MENCKVTIKRVNCEIDESELFHSDTFLGDEFSDEMYHWKYIKRVKKNGKWRYYYNKGQLKKDLGVDAKSELQTAKNELEFRQGVQKHIENKMENPTALDVHNYGGSKLDYMNYMAKQQMDHKYKVAAAEREVRGALQKYERTPLGKLEKAANKGRQFIKNIFKKK